MAQQSEMVWLVLERGGVIARGGYASQNQFCVVLGGGRYVPKLNVPRKTNAWEFANGQNQMERLQVRSNLSQTFRAEAL